MLLSGYSPFGAPHDSRAQGATAQGQAWSLSRLLAMLSAAQIWPIMCKQISAFAAVSGPTAEPKWVDYGS